MGRLPLRSKHALALFFHVPHRTRPASLNVVLRGPQLGPNAKAVRALRRYQ